MHGLKGPDKGKILLYHQHLGNIIRESWIKFILQTRLGSLTTVPEYGAISLSFNQTHNWSRFLQ
jgi:hypothetical protein